MQTILYSESPLFVITDTLSLNSPFETIQADFAGYLFDFGLEKLNYTKCRSLFGLLYVLYSTVLHLPASWIPVHCKWRAVENPI
jgi:hypothetical protein